MQFFLFVPQQCRYKNTLKQVHVFDSIEVDRTVTRAENQIAIKCNIKCRPLDTDTGQNYKAALYTAISVVFSRVPLVVISRVRGPLAMILSIMLIKLQSFPALKRIWPMCS